MNENEFGNGNVVLKMATWQQRSRAWLSGFINRQKKVPSLELLKHLHLELLKARDFGVENKKQLVETYRSISEVVIWGDQNDSRVFDYFLEHNMLSFFLKALSQSSDARVTVQLLQSLSIVFENITNEMAMYYLLSNNHVNCIIGHKYDFSNEEVLAYYISLLKTLSLRLNKHTIHLFYNEHLRDFPLLTESLQFFLHNENMVRIAVRNITLNIFRVADERVDGFVCQKVGPQFLARLMWYIGSVVIDAVQLVEENSPGIKGQLAPLIDAHLDHWTYLNDVLQMNKPQLTSLVVEHAQSKLLSPLYLASFLQCWDRELLQTGRQMDSQTTRQPYSQTTTQMDSQTASQRDIHMDWQTSQRDGQTRSQRDGQRDGQTTSQRDDQRDGQRDSQRDVLSVGDPVYIMDSHVQAVQEFTKTSQELIHTEEGPVQTEGEPVQTEEGPIQTEEGSVQTEEGSVQIEEGPIQTEEGPVQTEEEPVQTEEEPVQTEDGPVQTEDGPVQTKEGPIQTEEGPVQTEEEPVQTEEEPVQTEEEPVQIEEEPVQTEEEPVQTEEGPVQTKEGSVQTEEEPVQIEEGPVQTKEGSVQTEEEPVQTEEGPVQTKEGSVQTEEEPVQIEEGPVQTEEEPVQTEEGPVQTSGRQYLEELPDIKREYSVFFMTQVLSVLESPLLVEPFLKKLLQRPSEPNPYLKGFSILMDFLCCHDNEFFRQLCLLFLVTLLTNKVSHGVFMEVLNSQQLEEIQEKTAQCLSQVCVEGSTMSSRTGLLCLELLSQLSADHSSVKSCESLVRVRMRHWLRLMAGDEFVCLYKAQYRKVKSMRLSSKGLCHDPDFFQGHIQDTRDECEKVVLLFLSLHSFLKTEDLLPPCGLQLGDGDIIELSGFDMFMALLVNGGRETEQFVAVSQSQCCLVEPDRLPGQGKIKKVISLDELEYTPDPASSTTVYISQRGRRISFKLKFLDPFVFRAAIKCMGRNKTQCIRQQIEFIAKLLDTTPPDNVVDQEDSLLESFEIIHSDVGGVFDKTTPPQELEMSVFNHHGNHSSTGVRFTKEDGRVEMGFDQDMFDGEGTDMTKSIEF